MPPSEIQTLQPAVSVEAIDPRSPKVREFLALPDRIYFGDSRYFAPSRSKVLASLRRAEFDGRQQTFLAYDGSRPVARLAARIQRHLVDEEGRPYGLLGFFEAEDSPSAAAALFRQAIEWLHDRGAGPVVGPMDGDTWHNYRLNVGPYDARPFLMEPHNPAYYPGLWRQNGFQVLERYCSKRVEDLEAVIAAMGPKLEAAQAAGYRFEPLQIKAYEAALERLYDLSCRIFADNFLYTEIPRNEFLDLYRPSRALIDPDLVTFVRAPNGEDAGFLFAFPDHFHAVAAMRGRTGLWGKLRFLAARRRPEAVNLKSLGVVAEHRQHGLGAALMCNAYKTAQAKGYEKANLCLILDGNPSGRMEGGRGGVLRRYELYRWAGGAARGA